jgi:hypothetical protein
MYSGFTKNISQTWTESSLKQCDSMSLRAVTQLPHLIMYFLRTSSDMATNEGMKKLNLGLINWK